MAWALRCGLECERTPMSPISPNEPPRVMVCHPIRASGKSMPMFFKVDGRCSRAAKRHGRTRNPNDEGAMRTHTAWSVCTTPAGSLGTRWASAGRSRVRPELLVPANHQIRTIDTIIYLPYIPYLATYPLRLFYRFEANKEQLSRGIFGLHFREITKDLQRAERPAQRNSLAGFQPQTALGSTSIPGN